MRKIIVVLVFFIAQVSFGQSAEKSDDFSHHAFKHGEWLKYKMSYSNFLKAGESTIEVKDTFNNGKPAYHINGIGKSTGLVSLFFKVRDNYQSFMYKESLLPYRFIRKIDEGGHTRDKEILFDYESQEALVKDHKRKTEKKYPISNEIQDLLSALYFLRNQDFTDIEPGHEIELKMFFDQEIYNFKLRLMGREIIRTSFGKVKTLKFRPLVQAGRVFDEQESLTVWVTDDKNKIPLRIKASLAVGSLRADLDKWKGLAHPFNIIFDN